MYKPVDELRPPTIKKPKVSPPRIDTRSIELKSTPTAQPNTLQIEHLRSAVIEGLQRKQAK